MLFCVRGHVHTLSGSACLRMSQIVATQADFINEISRLFENMAGAVLA